MDYSNHGIGLRLGTLLPDGSRLGALDIDRADYVAVARVLLNDPPCGCRAAVNAAKPLEQNQWATIAINMINCS